MSRIEKTFADLKARGETALIPFVTAGDPDLPTTLKIMRALEKNGADCIELGIPFSDPTADGPTIQRSSERALKNAPITLSAILRFGYFNPIFRFGLKEFAQQAARSGVDGVLCVDLPPEESGELQRWTDAAGLDLIFLLSPTSGPERLGLVARRARGFIYYVSVTGVTGARRTLDNGLRARVGRVRKEAALPVGVGFGISTPEQAAWVAGFADAVVVGSALVEKIENTAGKNAKAEEAGRFVGRLKAALRKMGEQTPRRKRA
jgi:tryptophan synthase alpha chain